ncbi:MAG: NUDIX domain-containing protein [Thermoplasmata archaeon]
MVTSFIENNGRILLLRRSEFVGTYQGLWAGVSGYLERDEEPRERAEKEIEEEVGMRKLKLLAVGQRVVSRNKNRFWIVHPFLFHASSGEVKLDWEHTEYKWVYPQEIGEFETVPRLSKTFQAVVHAMPHSRKKR